MWVKLIRLLISSVSSEHRIEEPVKSQKRWWPLTFVRLFSIEWTKIDVMFVSVGLNSRNLLNSLELGPSPHVSSLLWNKSCFLLSNHIRVKTFLNVNTTMWSRTRMIIFFLARFCFPTEIPFKLLFKGASLN